MTPDCITQISERFGKAEKSLSLLEAATNHADAEEAWVDFLIATSTIYSKLEQAVKGNGRAQAWYGRLKKERKDNHVLRYIHFARNSDSHGAERIVSHEAGNATGMFGERLKFGERKKIILTPLDPVTKELGNDVNSYVQGPSIRAIRAHDRRYNDFCDPPIEDNGVAFIGQWPADIGRAALPYLSEIIENAASFV